MQNTDFTQLNAMLDIGANLAANDFNKDLDQVLDSAFNAGLEKIIITGSCFESVPKAQKIVQDFTQYKNKLFYTAGVHPHHSDEWQADSADFIRSFAQDDFCVATGEMGLDYFRNFAAKDIQLKCFNDQLDTAIEIGKPIFIHERDASTDMLEILQSKGKSLPKVVIHCFTGERQALENYIDAGFYIGITGWICDSARGAHLLDLVQLIPQDKLMIETDAPYLLPKNMRPKPKSRRNEPKYLPWVAEQIASALQLQTTELVRQTSLNAKAFFNLDKF